MDGSAHEIRRGNARGIAWMVAGVGALALMDAGLKLLAPHYPGMQVAALRGLAALPVILVWVLLRGRLRALLQARWELQVARGVLSICMLSTFAYALKTLPLSETYAIFFVAPLVITAMSVVFLKERVDGKRWAAVAVGMFGVVIVLRPTGEGMLTLAGLAVLFSALCYACNAIVVRIAARTDSTEALMFWMTTLLAAGATALAWHAWVPVRAEDASVIAGVAVTGAVGQYAMTEAFRQAQASIVAPFEYSALAWGVALDLALWGVLPDRYVFAGAAVIVASGIYLARREKVPTESERP